MTRFTISDLERMDELAELRRAGVPEEELAEFKGRELSAADLERFRIRKGLGKPRPKGALPKLPAVTTSKRCGRG